MRTLEGPYLVSFYSTLKGVIVPNNKQTWAQVSSGEQGPTLASLRISKSSRSDFSIIGRSERDRWPRGVYTREQFCRCWFWRGCWRGLPCSDVAPTKAKGLQERSLAEVGSVQVVQSWSSMRQKAGFGGLCLALCQDQTGSPRVLSKSSGVNPEWWEFPCGCFQEPKFSTDSREGD